MNVKRYEQINVARDALRRSLDITYNAMMKNIEEVTGYGVLVNSERSDRIDDILHTLHIQSMKAIRGEEQ